MSTIGSRITRAMQLLGVQASGETMEASIGADALVAANLMLAEWTAAGFGFTAGTFTALTEDTGLPAADDEAIAANLAVRMAPEFGMEASPTIQAGAAGLLAGLVARYSAPDY